MKTKKKDIKRNYYDNYWYLLIVSFLEQVFTEPIEGSRVGNIRLIVNQSKDLNAL